jgi:tripartite-type tricarboxylate transporter receptor subunit TctC
MLNRRQTLGAAIGAIAAGGSAPPACAETIDKVVRVIVGFPPGGGTDIVARVLAQALTGIYAADIIVEDKPGASARLAVEYVKNAPADGSVMLFTPDFPLTLYPSCFKSLTYDPVNDFIDVAAAAKGMLTLVVGPAVPADVKTLKDFIVWCKANPGKIDVADTSAGGTPHFTTVMLAREAGITLTSVHYRGGAPAMEDLIGGHVLASVNPVSEVIAFAKAGSIRPVAVTGEKRSPFLPGVPTMQEQGVNVVVESYSGVFLPAKTPAPIAGALDYAVRKATQSKQMIDNLAKFGTEPGYMSTPEFTAWIQGQIDRWGPVVKESGFKALD